ncbi:MAG: hypothetical protein K2H18_04480 [Muribaculaceae bacterium]|nr:hypothetical protein [Muribaculaceae bacterium]
MKQFLLPSALMLIAGLTVVSCGPTRAERELAARRDSIRRADSIAAVEAARIEKARQDSIEKAIQDSIAMVEAFESKIPSFTRIFNSGEDELRSYLTGLGFTRSKKGHVSYETGDGEETITYTLQVDPYHYCIFVDGSGYESYWREFTIVGAPEKWQQAKSEALRIKPQFMRDGNMPDMEIKSNSIIWGDGA